MTTTIYIEQTPTESGGVHLSGRHHGSQVFARSFPDVDAAHNSLFTGEIEAELDRRFPEGWLPVYLPSPKDSPLLPEELVVPENPPLSDYGPHLSPLNIAVAAVVVLAAIVLITCFSYLLYASMATSLIAD